MKTLYFAQCLHHEENDGKNSELFYLILRNRASQKVGQKKPEFVSKIKFLNNIDLPCPLRLYLYTGRKETRHSCSKLYCSKLGTISRQFLRVDCNLFNLGLDIQITAIPNCRLQSFFFSFFCHAKFDRFGLVEENPKKSAI